MNIIQIQNQLKGLPDNIIAGYVQNPNAQVPAYLALSELQRRKTTREEYQQNQQAPQQSVAQSLTSQIPPPQMQQPQAPQQQGVASLPMGNTPQPQPQPQQNFAHGGIVAFADGGDVDSLTAQAEAAFNAGDYEKAKALYAQSANMQEKANLGESPTMAPEQIDQAKTQIYNQLAAQRDAPSGIYTLDENLPQENIPEVVKGLPTLTAPDFVPNIDERAGPKERDVNRIRERDKGYADYPNGEALRVADAVRNNALIGDDMTAKMKERQKERTAGYKASADKSNTRLRELQGAKKDSRSDGLPVIDIPPEIIPKTAAGISSLSTPQTKQVPPAQRAPAAPQVPQTDLEKAQATYRAALAPDQKTRADLTGRMEHLDAQSKWMREHTDFDALTKAGLAMMQAGARPGASFLGAVGAGGEAGIKSLAEARDFQYATEEKRAALEQQLTQIERAERIAIAKYGVDSEEAKMVRADKITAAKALADASKEEKQAQREFDKGENKLQRQANKDVASIYATARAASGANSEAKRALDVVKASIGAVDKALAANEKELLKLSYRDNTDPAKAAALEKRRTLEAEKRTHQNQLNQLYTEITGEPAQKTVEPATPSTKGKLQQMPDGTFKYGP